MGTKRIKKFNQSEANTSFENKKIFEQPWKIIVNYFPKTKARRYMLV